MADGIIQLSPDSTGKKVDTEELTVGLNSVHRERMQIAGDNALDIAPVTAVDGLTVNLGTNNDVTVAGVSTLAEQQAQSVLLGTIDADTSLLAGTVAGTEVQVDVVSLPNEGQQTMLNSISVAIASDQSAVPVSGTVAVIGSATLAEQQAQTALLTTIDADTGGILTAVQLIDNAIAGTEMQVDVVTSALPTGAATLAEQQAQTTLLGTIDADTGGILTAVQILDNAIAGSEMQVDVVTMPVVEVVGDVAADAAVPANPLSIGGRASTAVPTAVSADGDSVYNWLNRNGLQVVSAIPGAGLNADPYTLLSVGAQYTTTQTSAVLLAGGASERIVVTSIQIQVGGTTAGTLQVYFGTGAFARGTNSAIFDGEFAPSATLKPGFVSSPPSGYRSPTLGHDVLVTTSAAINPLTITIWYYVLGV